MQSEENTETVVRDLLLVDACTQLHLRIFILHVKLLHCQVNHGYIGTIKVVIMFGFVLYKGCKRKATEELCVTPKRARLSETLDSIVKVCLIIIVINHNL